MPRVTRNSKRVAGSGEKPNNSSETVVASVNKPASRAAMSKSKTEKQCNSGGKRKSSEKKVKHQPKKSKLEKGKGKKGTPQRKVPVLKIQDKYKDANNPKIITVNGQPRFAAEHLPEVQNFDQVAEANFVEGEKVIKFTVDAEDDQNFDDSESEESEIEMDSDSSDDSQNSTDESSEGELDNSDDESNHRGTPTTPVMTQQEKQQRIENIDKEMSGKLKELHKMLSSRGLTESVKTMEQYFQVGQPSMTTTPKKPKGKCNRNSVKEKISFTPGLNKNQNHAHHSPYPRLWTNPDR